MITNLRMELFQALSATDQWCGVRQCLTLTLQKAEDEGANVNINGGKLLNSNDVQGDDQD